jgi:glycine betaine/proline transport system permease protein
MTDVVEGPVALDGAVLDRFAAPPRRVNPAKLALPIAVLGALVMVGALLGSDVPTWLDVHVKPWFDSVYRWSVANRGTHWLFTAVFSPIQHTLAWSVRTILWFLRWLRWPGVLALVGLTGLRVAGWRAAVAGTIAMAGCGVLGVWDHTMITLSFLLVAVVLALMIGVPLGIWAGLNDRANAVLRTFLDTAQVMPAFVYLLPLVIALDIGGPPAVIATVIFAVPPAVRLTSLGIRDVPLVATEVGQSFGSTTMQLLTKVQLPMARRAVLLGLNQVIMMAFGVVALASIVGTGDLGQDVRDGLQKVNVGAALVPGLALVFCAIALDRITTGERPKGETPLPNRLFLALAAGVVVIAIAAHAFGINDFPKQLTFNLAKPVNQVKDWITEHLRSGVPIVGGTKPISDFIVRDILTPFRDFLLWFPWWVVVVFAGAVGWLSRGRKLAALCMAALIGIASLRVWDLAMNTLSQVLVAVAVSVALAVPIGIWAGRSDRVNAILRPLLDTAQVMPSFVYLVPVIALVEPGRVPGVIASVIYALPPGIRLVSLGLRAVPHAPREAALSFGATPRQELVKVQLPLALKSIMLGINQTILMVLSMVVIGALVGGGALGNETVVGISRREIGRGVAGGVAIVLLAIVLDRVTQAWGDRAGFSSTTNP